ncbi:MAG: hypothetical protein JSR17_06420 [Proteobacteria bacterium]|nr:hypothetical protein [Pseudomonadota bacterium]
MAKRTSPLSLKRMITSLKSSVQGLFQPKQLALEPLEPPQAKKPRANTKWVLAETSDNDDNNKRVVMVEVESFADTNTTPKGKVRNYTIEGEDPNLRITHYPSNRLH